jgi:hypothetical protein
VPWSVAVGAAYRFAPTPWNPRVDTLFRDERALLIAADVVVTGAVRDGHGLEAFARHRMQRSGRHVVVSPRLGAELELIPGWLRVRAGTYWEPARFDAVSGRLHGTTGFDLRLFEVPVGRRVYRPHLSLVIDAAPRYGNLGVSIGFWR